MIKFKSLLSDNLIIEAIVGKLNIICCKIDFFIISIDFYNNSSNDSTFSASISYSL